jgi:A/G-specific adenine glycosylase
MNWLLDIDQYWLPHGQIIVFQNEIFDFYALHKRMLPRRDAFDWYKVWISEIMLQQTQVSRVVAYFERWMIELPDVFALANCDKQKLLQLWSGLGFNSRALRLQQCANMIVQDFWWDMPRDYYILQTLPGIWPYTAGAIMNFAFNTAAPMVDTNIRRILLGKLDIPDDLSMKDLYQLSLLVTPVDRPNDRWNALMDYGALYYTSQKSWIKAISKQSKFAWSQRQVRWRIVKQLTAWNIVTLSSIYDVFPRDDLQFIIDKIIADGIVYLQWESLVL